MNIPDHIGVTIRSQRKRLQLTMLAVAELANVSRHTIRQVETQGDCTLGALHRICAAIGLEIRIGIRGAPTREQLP